MNEAPRTVLFLHPSADLYGADRTLLDLVRELDRGRWTPLVAVPRVGPLVAELEAVGARVVIGPLGVGARATLQGSGVLALARELPRAVAFVRRLVREHEVALVHTNTMIVLGGALGARLAGVPHLWHVHEILVRPRWLARGFARAFRLLAGRVVWNSHATARGFLRHEPRLARRSEVIWNGVDPRRVAGPQRDRDQVRAELGLSPGTPLVGMVGRVNAWKGQRLLVHAFREVLRRVPDARLVLAGDHPPGQPGFARELEAEIARLGLSDAVRRLPFEDDVASLFAASDVAVVPSTRPEPFGLVAIEAMAMGTPVVAANHGGLAEVVQHERTGLLFQPGDADALAGHLTRLLQDPERARALGREGRARQRSTFRLTDHVRRMERAYGELLAGQAPRPAQAPTPEVVHLVLGKANPARMNGVNAVVHHLAEAQAEDDLRVEVWGLTADPDAPTPPRPYGLRLFDRGRWRFRTPADLRRAIADLPPTCFHLHGGLLPEWWAVARHLVRDGHRVVLTPHGAYRPDALRKRAWTKALYLRLFERPLLRRVERVQAFTAAGAREIARLVSPDRVTVLPNGVRVPDSPHAADPAQARAAGEGPLVAFCGRLDAHTKGLDLLLEGLHGHVASGGTCRMLWIGDGPDRPALEARARELGLEKRLHLTGALFDDDKRAALTSAHAFVLASRHEGMPVAALEAAALGLPLWVSEGTRIADEVRAAGAGRVLGDDGAGVARALDELQRLHELGRLAALGRRARDLALERFPWSRIAHDSRQVLYRIPERDSEGGGWRRSPAAPAPGVAPVAVATDRSPRPPEPEAP